MCTRHVGVVTIAVTLVLTACSGDGNDADAGGCDLDACVARCLGDGGGVAACVADECLCFPLPHDADDEGEGEAERG